MLERKQDPGIVQAPIHTTPTTTLLLATVLPLLRNLTRPSQLALEFLLLRGVRTGMTVFQALQQFSIAAPSLTSDL